MLGGWIVGNWQATTLCASLLNFISGALSKGNGLDYEVSYECK